MTHNPRVSRAETRCDLEVITNAKEDRGESRETLGIVDRFSTGKTKGETILLSFLHPTVFVERFATG